MVQKWRLFCQITNRTPIQCLTPYKHGVDDLRGSRGRGMAAPWQNANLCSHTRNWVVRACLLFMMVAHQVSRSENISDNFLTMRTAQGSRKKSFSGHTFEGDFFEILFRASKKFFFLSGQAVIIPPLLVAGPLNKRTFLRLPLLSVPILQQTGSFLSNYKTYKTTFRPKLDTSVSLLPILQQIASFLSSYKPQTCHLCIPNNPSFRL